jgi:hypothetical protein
MIHAHLQNTVGLADNHVESPRIQGPRMAPGAAIGRTIPRNITGACLGDDWQRTRHGIRKPTKTEIPLSWQEVKHWLEVSK